MGCMSSFVLQLGDIPYKRWLCCRAQSCRISSSSWVGYRALQWDRELRKAHADADVILNTDEVACTAPAHRILFMSIWQL